jgi:protein-S-isoprenylcysteine O-methyltransferase Ste14
MRQITPPIYGLVCIALSVALAGVGTGMPLFPVPLRIAGAVLAPLGGLFAFRAKRMFQRAGTPVNPFHRPAVLVTAGPFRYSRNPMYLGVMAGILGVAVALGRPLSLLGPVVMLVILDRGFIPREERIMRELFGEAYVAYARRVRRWVTLR